MLTDTSFINQITDKDFEINDHGDGAETITAVKVSIFPLMLGEEYYEEAKDKMWQQQDHEAAKPYIDLAFAVGYDNPGLYNMRGYYYSQIDDWDSCIEDLSENTKLRPNDPYGFVIRGWCYNDKGDLTRAANEFINFLDLAGDDPEFESNREPVESWLASH